MANTVLIEIISLLKHSWMYYIFIKTETIYDTTQ